MEYIKIQWAWDSRVIFWIDKNFKIFGTMSGNQIAKLLKFNQLIQQTKQKHDNFLLLMQLIKLFIITNLNMKANLDNQFDTFVRD